MLRQYKIGIGALISIVGDDERQWKQRIDIFRDQDAEFAEVWVEHWRGIQWLVENKVERLQSLLAGIDIILHAPFGWHSLITPTKAIREYTMGELRATLELGEALGGRGVTVHGGALHVHYLRREASAKELLEANLRELLPLAQRTGQFLAVENMPGLEGLPRTLVYPARCADLLEVTSMVPGVTCTLDVGHAFQNSEAPVQELRSLLPILSNIHLHDYNNQGKAHRSLGTGALELDALLDVLMEGGYSGYLTLEVFDTDDSKTLIRNSYRYLRNKLESTAGSPPS